MSQLKLSPRYTKALARLVNHNPYFSLLSMKIKDLQWGTSVVELRLEKKHLQSFGIAHGGVMASILDGATFFAVFPQVKEGNGLTTVEIKVNYLAPVQRGRLVAEGRCIKLGRTIALGEAYVRNGKGALVAHGTATMMVVPGLQISGYQKLPPSKV